MNVQTGTQKSVTVTIGFSTNPQVKGRYFASLADTTGNSNNQLTTWTSDADDVMDFISSVERHAEPRNIAVVINDTTRELAI